MTEEPILRVEGLKKHYRANEGFIENIIGREIWAKAVDGVSFDLMPGETLGIVGESGCGKSTLGRSVFRLIDPTEGEIYYRPEGSDEEIALTTLSRSEMREMRKDLQYIFQDPFSSMNPRWTVGEIIAEPLEIHGLASGPAKDERVYELLDIVGLNASHANRYPHEFSGGQRQRIGIARSLAVDPEVLICDEPVSALDVSVQAQILNLLEDLQDEFGLTYIFIAHDLSVVEHISDRVGVMYLGEIVEMGETVDVFRTPRHPYTEALLSVIPEPDPVWQGDKILLEGEVPSPINPPSGCRLHPRCHRIIQPDDVDIDQSVWRSLMHFKERVTDAETLDDIVITDTDEETTVSQRELEDLIREEYDLPSSISEARLESTFTEVVAALSSDDGIDDASGLLTEEFTSPCESIRPELTPTETSQEVGCLLYTEEYAREGAESAGQAPADD